MELVDRLLAILAGPNPRHASQQLMAAGHTEDEVRGAWNFARSAGQGLGVQVTELNGAISALAAEMNTSASPVIAVDQNTGFNVNADLKADGIHPTESGFAKMAERWFAAIDA